MGAKLSDIGKIIQQALGSSRVLEVAGESAIGSIQLRTRLGRGVSEPEGSSAPLPKLKDKTKYNRKLFVTETKKKINVKKTVKERLKELRKGKLKKALQSEKTKTVVASRTLKDGVDPNYFTPAKSNLTLSGQLLNSLKFTALKSKLVIFLDNQLAVNKTLWTQAINPRFNFMNLSRVEVDRMIREMSKEVTVILEKIKFDKL